MRPPSQPRRIDVPESERSAYDSVVDRFRAWRGLPPAAPNEQFELGAYFGALMTSPPMCATASQFGVFFRDVGNRRGSYSHADREFVDQVLSALWKTNVVLVGHIVEAVEAGVRVEAIEALRTGRDDLLTPDEQLLAAYIRQVVDGAVQDGTYNRMLARLGARGLVEYTGFILWLQWIMRMMQALDTGAISDAEVDALIERARALPAKT